MNELMQVDFGKLSEQYAGFLAALGGISITVLALVLSLGSPRARSFTSVKTRANFRPALIAALIVATVSCFIGAHLMAETAAFVSQAAKSVEPDKSAGARLFLLASINIYIAVTVVIFALMLLTAEYRRGNENAAGIRKISTRVFCAVVLCVFCWMFLTAAWRIPAPRPWRAITIPFAAVAGSYLVLLRVLRGSPLWNRFLLRLSFGLIIGFTVSSLIWFAISLHLVKYNRAADRDVMLFVGFITATCVLLGDSGRRLMKHMIDGTLWPANGEDRGLRRGLLRQRYRRLHDLSVCSDVVRGRRQKFGIRRRAQLSGSARAI